MAAVVYVVVALCCCTFLHVCASVACKRAGEAVVSSVILVEFVDKSICVISVELSLVVCIL